MRRSCGTMGLALLLLLGWALPAASQLGIAVSPPRVEHRLASGADETDVIIIRNRGDKAARIKVYLQDWTMAPTGDVNYLPPGRGPHSCAPWLQINPRDFRLEPGMSRQVRYTLTVPATARTGGYWAAIMFEAMPAVAVDIPWEQKLAVHGRIATIVYETVGNPEIKAQLKDFLVSPEKKGLVFKLVLANQGEGHFRLKKSQITLKNARGQEVAQVTIPDIPVLPGNIRELEIRHDQTLPPGEYQAEVVLDVGRRELLGRKKPFSISR